MKKPRLNFRFHNTNPLESFSEFLIGVMIEVNIPYFEKKLLNAVSTASDIADTMIDRKNIQCRKADIFIKDIK